MDEIVGVVTVMFAAVKLEHAHPLRRATIGYGALWCLRPVTGLQLKMVLFSAPGRVATVLTGRVSRALLSSAGTDSISGMAIGTVQSYSAEVIKILRKPRLARRVEDRQGEHIARGFICGPRICFTAGLRAWVNPISVWLFWRVVCCPASS